MVALGHKALGTTLPEQLKAVKNAAKAVADLVEEGCNVAITHSNGPQVGMIHTAMNEFGRTHGEYTMTPMSVCSAMSQGYIGYDLQNAIREELLNRGIFKTVLTVVTQVLVDPYDEAFYEPTKTIGGYLSAEEAEKETKKGNFVVEIEGKGFRRIVAAPKPIDIVETDAINTLVNQGNIVIAGGGGGIPVFKQGTHLKGASAVIEKDYLAGKMADLIDADNLVILTGVEKVALNYESETKQPLDVINVKDGITYIKEGHFGATNMLPKIKASIDFVSAKPNRTAIITELNKARDGFLGRTGTKIIQ